MAAKKSEFDIRPLIEKVKRIPGMLQREIKPLVWQQSRLFIKEVVDITPPASKGVSGPKARKQGESAVARDIYRVYTTIGKAYDAIARTDKAAASAFYFLVKEGNYQEAGEIMRHFSASAGLGNTRSFARFDDGKLHQRFRGKRGGVSRDRVVLLVTNAQALQSYVKKVQGRVGLLAAGWMNAAQKLGVRMPAWIARHGASNGAISVEVGIDKLLIVMSNKVKYGAANDLQRRADYVVRYRHQALRRRLPYVLRAALKRAGLQVRAAAA